MVGALQSNVSSTRREMAAVEAIIADVAAIYPCAKESRPSEAGAMPA